MADCPASAVLLLCILNVLFSSSYFYFLPNDKFSLVLQGPAQIILLQEAFSASLCLMGLPLVCVCHFPWFFPLGLNAGS